MSYLLQLTACLIFFVQFTTVIYANVPCPAEDEVTCVECKCHAETGFNRCRPVKECPGPLNSAAKIRAKNRMSKCPYGPSFHAQCTLCDCSGSGADNCAMCFALPVRRLGQPEEVNRRIPQATDNRFFNYEINGWDARMEDDI